MGLKDKAARIDFGSLIPPAVPSDAEQVVSRPKTAPGLMMAHSNEQRSELLRENETLRERAAEHDILLGRVSELQDELKVWDGAKATRSVDPRLIARSRWANRDVAHFATPEFLGLKAEIQSAGGNIQPVKIRPLPKPDANGAQFEIVFGHRRHQACLELGLPVLALVDNMDERGLFAEMDRENRSRANLSPWEQGRNYRRALDAGLFSSNRKLAEAVGADLGNLGRALALADLPGEVVAAFASPFDLQYRWAKPLTEALERDRQGVLKRASGLAAQSPRPSPRAVLEQLLGTEVLPQREVIDIKVKGKVAASMSTDARGQVQVTIRPGLLDPQRLPELASALQSFLAPSTGGKTR